MSVFPQFLLAFMSSDFSQFALSSAGHLTLLFQAIWRHKPLISDYKIIEKRSSVKFYIFTRESKANSSPPLDFFI